MSIESKTQLIEAMRVQIERREQSLAGLRRELGREILELQEICNHTWVDNVELNQLDGWDSHYTCTLCTKEKVE